MAHEQYIRRIIQDMCKFVMFHFENDPPGEDEVPEEPKEDLFLPTALKNLLRVCVGRFRNCGYLHAFDHYAQSPNPAEDLNKTMQQCVMEAAKEMADRHMRFLRECSLFFMVASLLKKSGLMEAPEIIVDAIYNASVETTHHENLRWWGAIQSPERNSAIAENPAENPAGDPAENPAENPAEDSAEDSADDSAENPAENPAEDLAENPA